MNKNDAEFNSASFLFMTLFCPSRHFEDIERFGKYFPKNAKYLKNSDSDKKVYRIKKTRNSIVRLFYSVHVFDPIRRFRDIERFLENIFQKAQYLENGDSDQKSITDKKDA